MQLSPRQFYSMMGYPIPEQAQYFIYKNTTGQIPETKEEFSQEMQDRIHTINKYSRLRNNLPYIQAIYLCDSMSFNAANQGSDIDLFFIVKHKSIRRARFWTVIIFRLLGLKRSLRKKSGFFDLIFYIDEERLNIEDIALQPEDIYLSYRLAHLIPLYEEKQNIYNIYQNNTWIQKILPHFPMQHTIQLPITKKYGKGRYKRSIEFLGENLCDNLWEYLLNVVRKPLVIRKKKRHGEQGRGIVITGDMLKFHADKRKSIQDKRNKYINETKKKKDS